MRFVADLHLHSKYSRAVSPKMTLPVMSQLAQQKGLDILTASDFTHPRWLEEIKEQLEDIGGGLYALKSEYRNPKLETNTKVQTSKLQKDTLFLLSTEISCIYKQDGKVRRVHNLIFVPNLGIADKVNRELVRRGCNITADGRPIVGISSRNLLEMILSIDERCMLIPCHIWTPHFGVYGSASGFDSLEEAFGDLASYVYGIETGISSDPGMNWGVNELRNRSILSFSDAHSAPKMGREATVFELESPTYENIRKAIMYPSVIARSEAVKQSNLIDQIAAPSSMARNDNNKIAHTLEFYPEEGKYHFSGHRNCKVSLGPEEIRLDGNICPVCKRRMTEGVLFRVQQLVDGSFHNGIEEKIDEDGVKWFTDRLGEQPPYVKLVPLLEIVAESLSMTVGSQKAKNLYTNLINNLGSEIDILLSVPIKDIAKVGGERLTEAMIRARAGKITIDTGYDGVYGKVRIFDKVAEKNQMKLNI
jgi:PHP family Zn ribbon phosphoesterase